ncbi:2-octaprenyl-6-methoxyphenyl hydroxylase [Shewanella xiamenensis]|uniref:2-octaprenyl-6-methoxyphenyl hydroxylase n=1 Tax=Shewanella xiamenensis TaxID=332186 RepID=UPI001184A8C8|nr:2-octaprenyl-6-methoxyphenyl hydroxylase [Shewanella xiamenensis]TVL21550.1 2-octaprenyl-6-methoxyphenyl hydroxylase [Shewanella xiamenensis]TVL21736.1 2-octaprenyl-6-methoxyphenyl hydroxylase [Shewanella xiamenensis]TVL27633.1 2-octaprenyl-6-methoxyphenyl hydroxylase [Shewanella xiamenensis]TVL35483.1 2-octaprenyl-6-methoxyphenyl hydroxylase [Shewanella xiamenensis]TVP03771.1 2-octaprenyl-6-methoxyphenyl hydroxylase [Shewanella xiamenensis]
MTVAEHMDNSVQNVDIAIVGGAMAGATLALALARLSGTEKPLSIALIEAHLPDNNHPGFDARSIAIAHGSIFELSRLGLWPKLAHLGTAIKDIHVSDRGHFGMTELNASQFHLDALGQVVELERVGQVLFSELHKTQVKLYCPAKLSALIPYIDSHTLVLDSGERICAKLVVAADGLQSKVRSSFNLPITQVAFEQTAIIANLQTDKPHQHWAYERFTETGPLALLPMADSQGQPRLSLVWALDNHRAQAMLNAPKAEFLAALQQAFGYRAGQFIDVSERHAYPLNLSYMPRPIHHRCVFIGNAAQTLHPIAGQGFNLGLRDVVSLLEVLNTAREQGEDIGGVAVTHGYLQAREADRNSTIRNIEFLVRGFSNQYWPLALGRNLGLRLLSWFPPLKTPVAQKAMGWK